MKRKILILSVVLSLFISFGIITYAYFIKTIEGKEHGISSAPNDTKVVEVSTYNEFIQEVRLYDTSNSEFNSSSNVSLVETRKTIKLTSNISLLSDMLINADCHIDLNGKTLDLNGYNLTFRYHYDGVYAVYGGTITDKSIFDVDGNIINGKVPGSIIVDCPNAIIKFDETEVLNDVEINVSDASDNQIVNSAMNFILANIQNTGINDFYTINDSVHDISIEDCEFEHNSGDGCIYTFTDLDFIYNYYTYEDLSITYESSNEQVLSSNGNINVGLTTETVDLTITVTYGEATISKIISVHVVVEEDYVQASNLILNKNLNRYYNSDLGLLLFNNSFVLPKENTYFGTTYSYELKTNNPDYSINSDGNSDFFDLATYDEYLVVSLSKEIIGLEITSKKNGSSATTDAISLSGESTTLVDDNHSYAVNIIRDLYGNQIFISDGQVSETTYTERDDILIDPSYKGYTRIASISNQLINNTDETYELIDFPEFDVDSNPLEGYQKYQILRVNTNSDVEPNIGQSVFLSVTFIFTERYGSEEITIQVPIIFKPGLLDTGESFAAFDPYFVYFNSQFKNATNNYGFDSFEIPLSYDGERNHPTYKFIIFEQKGNTTTKLVDGELFTQSTTNGTNANFTKETLMNIDINPYYIEKDTLTYLFAYIPTYVGTTGNIYYYDQTSQQTTSDFSQINIDINTYPYVSKLIVPGIVRYQCENTVDGKEEVFADKEFYAMAYSLLNDGELYEEGKFILTSRLHNQVDGVNFMNKATISFAESDVDTNINSLKGINEMTGIRALSLQNIDLSANDYFVRELEYISHITNLRILNLSSTNIYDQTGNTIGFPSGDSNNILETLSALTNLEELYLANNKIYSFAALTDFASLKKVDISNNAFASNFGWQVIDNLLSQLVNSLYGTFGVNNISTITNLETSGVEVIKGVNNNGELHAGMKRIVKVLSSFEYQDRLDKDVDINNVLALYPSGNTSTIRDLYDIPESFVITGDRNVTFTFTSVAFVETTAGFKIQITYHWVSDGLIGNWGSQNGDIVFENEFKVSRY